MDKTFKIESLTPEQEAKLPEYVAKWTEIGLNTDACNIEETKKLSDKIYATAELAPPKYFFHFQSPFAAAHAAFMVDQLSNFDESDTSKEIYGDTSKWLYVFEDLYNQYSAQYDLIEWNEDVKARMLSKISKAYVDKSSTELPKFLDHMMYGAQDASWLSFYDFFLQEFDLECVYPLIPHLELARHCGWWAAYEQAVFVQDRPLSISIVDFNGQKHLHNETGPAVEYRDAHKLYALENYWVDEVVVMNPEAMTVEMIEFEDNAEKRRIMLQRYGYEKYFENSDSKVIDRDFVHVDNDLHLTMPRMLVQTRNDDLFLVGSDGSTERTYIMPISSRSRVESRFGEIKTCKQAHQLICGLDESKCLAQS